MTSGGLREGSVFCKDKLDPSHRVAWVQVPLLTYWLWDCGHTASLLTASASLSVQWDYRWHLLYVVTFFPERIRMSCVAPSPKVSSRPIIQTNVVLTLNESAFLALVCLGTLSFPSTCAFIHLRTCMHTAVHSACWSGRSFAGGRT